MSAERRSLPERADVVEVLLPDGRQLAARVRVARGLLSRFLGLMGRREVPAGEGIWLVPCRSIHMFFMRTAIDILFLDAEGEVVRSVSRMRPWSLRPFSVTLSPVRGARSTLELAPGTLERMDFSLPARLLLRPVPGLSPHPQLTLE
ncbi:MAG: DUF192 domain-containing protein [Candidatus Dormibacteraeota bacterium]|nr:DUF192 domain-containing protein [Candidatus Dormibacteraeota bacterium]